MQNMAHLKQRLIAGGFGIIVLLATIALSQATYFRPLFAALCGGVIAGAVWEYYGVAKKKGFRPLRAIGVITSFLYVMATFINTQLPKPLLLPEICLFVSLLTAFIYYFSEGEDPFQNLAVTFFGIVYLAIPLSCLVQINYFFPHGSPQDGRIWLLYLLTISKITDIAAYFFGKTLGQTPLAPYISPKKTWVGAMGGTTCALVTSLAFWYCLGESDRFSLTFMTSILLGLVLSLASQIGDLAESLLKRDAGVKDSNHLPGLGGMLDIVDSLVFTSPITYLFLKGIGT